MLLRAPEWSAEAHGGQSPLEQMGRPVAQRHL